MRTQGDALSLLGAPRPRPFSPEWGRGRGQTRRGERSRSPSAAAHKALHLLLSFQAPPWASLFGGSRMPPSVVGGTVRLPLAALPPPSHLSLLLPAPRHRPLRKLRPGLGGTRVTLAPRERGQRSSLRGTTSPSRSATHSGAHTHPAAVGSGLDQPVSRRRGSPAAGTLLPARRGAARSGDTERPARAPRRGAAALVLRRRQLQRPLARWQTGWLPG